MFYKFLRDVPRTSLLRPKVTSAQRRPWNLPRMSILNIIQSTLLLYSFPSYSPNVLSEVLKSQSLLTLKVLGKCPLHILKTFRKDVCSITSLGRRFWISRTNAFSLHYFQLFFTKCVPETLKSQLLYSFRFLEKPPKYFL